MLIVYTSAESDWFQNSVEAASSRPASAPAPRWCRRPAPGTARAARRVAMAVRIATVSAPQRALSRFSARASAAPSRIHPGRQATSM